MKIGLKSSMFSLYFFYIYISSAFLVSLWSWSQRIAGKCKIHSVFLDSFSFTHGPLRMCDCCVCAFEYLYASDAGEWANGISKAAVGKRSRVATATELVGLTYNPFGSEWWSRWDVRYKRGIKHIRTMYINGVMGSRTHIYSMSYTRPLNSVR